jgi:hypothetical protein
VAGAETLVEPSSNGHGHADDGSDDPGARRRPWRRRVALAVVLLVAAAWGFALWYSLTRVGPEPLDVESRGALRSACTDAAEALRGLPALGDRPTASQRVARIREENAVFATLLDRARRVQPTNGEGARALDGFLTDWKALVRARVRYAHAVATAPRARLEIPVDPAGAPATRRMDDYAVGHDLRVCSPLALQAEIVEGARDYRRAR